MRYSVYTPHGASLGKWLALALAMAGIFAGVSAQAEVLQYQARLTDPATGAPREGLLTVTFSIYDAPAGGMPLWTETKIVAAVGGLMNTLLGDTEMLTAALFDGRDLWLGVTVDTDEEAAPRQRIASVAYALRATESANAATLDGQDAADFAAAAHAHNADDINSGVLDEARIPPAIARDAEITGIVRDNDGAGSGLDADVLDGLDSTDFAGAAHGHDAAAINSGVLDESRIPETIARDAEVMGMVLANDGAGSGLDADWLDGFDSSDFVRSTGPTSITGSHANPILDVTQSGSGFAGRFTSATSHGVVGITASSSNSIAGVRGIAGAGGTSITGKHGVLGESDSGKGVVGVSSTSYGVYGWSSTGSSAVRGEATNLSVAGVSGANFATTGTAYGVRGSSSSTSGIGVSGQTTAATGTTYGVKGVSASTTQGAGLYGDGGYVGVWGEGGGWGVYGRAATDGKSIYGSNPGGTGYAGYFAGNTHVTGSLTKAAGSFKIDHPLDPENKYLLHSFVESPDMMNVYNGNIVLDDQGEALVTLPDWFEALNRDFRYQLTAIGGPGPNLYVTQEIAGNQFQIAGGAPGLKVSWQVTGIRQDPYAEAHRIPVEEDKPQKEKGAYLHPEEYGVDKTKAITQASEPATAE
jgi:hypothetical protein